MFEDASNLDLLLLHAEYYMARFFFSLLEKCQTDNIKCYKVEVLVVYLLRDLEANGEEYDMR